MGKHMHADLLRHLKLGQLLGTCLQLVSEFPGLLVPGICPELESADQEHYGRGDYR